jgi:D-serine dehydratase
MRREGELPDDIRRQITEKKPFLWINTHWSPITQIQSGASLGLDHVVEAESRLQRYALLLRRLFPELEAAGGIIESPLIPAAALQKAMRGPEAGRWFIKGDHALPVAGSIKARGGIYEVLVHAEDLALRHGIIHPGDDVSALASPTARSLYSEHEVAVGSTGNLGLSIGIVSAALGFQATVHMSADAKEWKKARLRSGGVRVVEHDGDFGAAVAAGRSEAHRNTNAYFVDDENSRHLFLGYSVAALRLREQLRELGIGVDAEHPLFVYLPCGVGGAPGGITFGLRHLFGDHVHCFLAEPVASPCLLIRLASRSDAPISVQDIGLDNRTEADGLAVGRASEFVAPLMRSLLSGIFTVRDETLFEDLYLLERSEGLRIEPSAAAGFRGPNWVMGSDAGWEYLGRHDLLGRMENATHVLWTTGGAFVPNSEYQRFHERGRLAALRVGGPGSPVSAFT